MTETARFCTACGERQADDARFCTVCGAALPAATSQAESVVALIPNASMKGGFLGLAPKSYTLVLTDRRIIFAHITSEMMKQLVNDARGAAKADGKGFMGQWGAQLSAYSKFAERYRTMDPEQALAETPENFAIENATIQKAKIKSAMVDENGQSGSDKLQLKTSTGKYSVSLGSGAGPAKEALVAARLI